MPSKLYHKEKQRVVLCLMQINIYKIPIHMYIHNYYLFFETIVSKAWSTSSVFLIINILFHGVSIAWILNFFFLLLSRETSFSITNYSLSQIKLFENILFCREWQSCWLIKRKQKGLPLFDANKHIHIYGRYVWCSKNPFLVRTRSY